jgi:CheY-like chemotaxis protein
MDRKKILVVDDEADVIMALSTVLESQGYKVISANSKQEGLKLARAAEPDLAILDVMMSTHYEGFELAQDLVNDPECKNIPILMHTSVEVFTTSEQSVREMAREYRKDPKYRELQVILLKDLVSGKAGIDYKTEAGQSVWVPVGGFLNKPVEPQELLQEVKALLGK